jgi:hypothetical protein
MDTGQIIYVFGKLFLGTTAAFLAIVLWSRSRDAAWMFMVFGALASYIEILYSILLLFGITGENLLRIGSVPLPTIILECLPWLFFIVAFLIMAIRKLR